MMKISAQGGIGRDEIGSQPALELQEHNSRFLTDIDNNPPVLFCQPLFFVAMFVCWLVA